MKNRHAFTFPFVVAIACTGTLGTASAQTRTWTTTSPDGNSGNWSDTTKWSGGDVPDTSGEVATFGAYANNRAITLDGNYTVGGLSVFPRTSGFVGTTFALSGGNTLTIGSGGVTIGGGNTVSISSNIALGANQTWTSGTSSDNTPASLTVSGVISGAFALTRTTFSGASSNSATFTGANTFSGGYTNSTSNPSTVTTTRIGTSTVVTGGLIESGPLGTGTVTFNTGTLSSNASGAGSARTLHNNIVIGGNVTLGNATNNGALTFSDSGLTTASTFTLGSANNGNVTVLRNPNTTLNIDQVIAESGGTGQSVNFASTTGTPTVTLSRTKTSTGNILSGGVALVLTNGAANSGSIAAVNGSVTATGSNKFSSGALISDNTALIATDTTNYSAVAGGKATIYNNSRVSFATDQNQATLAGLFTSDSQVRIGLSSAALSPTVTQNYDQSAIGNGRAGLVSASTGTVTYNGTLTAGSDNTYRVGSGLGNLILGTALTGSGKNLLVESFSFNATATTGTTTTSVDNTYTGSTTLNGSSLTVSGLNGALSGTTGITINNAATLNLTNNTGAVKASRVGDSVGLTLNNGLFALNGSATTAASETLGNLTINSGGRNFVTIAQSPTAAIKILQFGTLTRNAGTVAVFRGDSLGGTGTARNEIKFSSAPTLIGGAGAAGTTNMSILSWARGGTASGNNASGFVTYETNGIRQLAAGEYVNATDTSNINVAIGANTDRNVSVTSAVTTGASTVNSANSTVNALLFINTGATAAQTFNLGSSTVTVTSGAVHVLQSVGQNLTIGSGTLAFGGAEGVITSNNNGFLTTIGTQITGTNGLTVSNLNGGGISLSAVTTAGFSGGLTIGGNGFVGVDQDQRFGDVANSVTHGGGTLQFFAGFTSTRGLTLLGNVGNNTLANNTTSTAVTWNGDISGTGLLRLINNASTAGTGGFGLGGNNSYSGGTQIEGISVTGSSNNAFGTGTVTLISANSNVSNLTLTGTAPTLGGLRGTDGTVTINPTASTGTLTVGANDSSNVFNGVIAQGSGKTGSLDKVGTGTLVLGGNNTYTGTTTVSGGTLNVSGSLAGGNVSVAADSTLTGNGIIGGATTINSIGVHNAGGIGSVGKQNFSSSIDYSTGSIFAWDLAATPDTTGRGTNYDAVNAASLGTTTGAIFRVVLNGAQDFSSSFWETTRQWTDIFKTGDSGTNLDFASIFSAPIQYYNGNGELGSVTQGSFSITGSTLTWSAVPEPTSALAGILIAAGLLRRRRA